MDMLKSIMDLHSNPLMNYIVEIKRLRVVKIAKENYSEERLRFKVLDEDGEAFLLSSGCKSFCCFRWRGFDLKMRDNKRRHLLQITKDCASLEANCFCSIFCPNSASVVLLGNENECLGGIRENCSSLFASYAYEDERGKVLARLEGPLIVSGLLGIGQLKWLQPQVVFKLVDLGGKEYGKITRQWGASELICPDQYEIEYSGWLSPRLRLLILGSVFMIVSIFDL